MNGRRLRVFAQVGLWLLAALLGAFMVGWSAVHLSAAWMAHSIPATNLTPYFRLWRLFWYGAIATLWVQTYRQSQHPGTLQRLQQRGAIGLAILLVVELSRL